MAASSSKSDVGILLRSPCISVALRPPPLRRRRPLRRRPLLKEGSLTMDSLSAGAASTFFPTMSDELSKRELPVKREGAAATRSGNLEITSWSNQVCLGIHPAGAGATESPC